MLAEQLNRHGVRLLHASSSPLMRQEMTCQHLEIECGERQAAMVTT